MTGSTKRSADGPPGGASPIRRSCCCSTAARASWRWGSGWWRPSGLEGEIELAALAKQFEEVYRPGVADPVRIPRGSEALYLLQRLRDEAHRFAITFHRQRRGTRMTASVLDGVPGLGTTRRTRLLKELGGVRALRTASVEDLRDLSWLPDPVAEAVYARLHDAPGPPTAAAGSASVVGRMPADDPAHGRD